MKVLLLGDVNSSHIQRWFHALQNAGIDVALFSLSIPADQKFKSEFNLVGDDLNEKFDFSSGIISKLRYLKMVPGLKSIIKQVNPDIVHAHYASSYGLLGALASTKPLVISTWGTDIYEFPEANFITKQVLRFTLGKATRVTATSVHLASATQKYLKSKVEVVPFGIDTKKFSLREESKSENFICIGTIKALELIYGIDILIKAFSICRRKLPYLKLKLLLAGGGSLEGELKKLAKAEGIEDVVSFVGKVPYSTIQEVYKQIDIFVNVSRFESFGVSVLEASSTGLPVVLSDAGGLAEVGIQNRTCIFVKPDSIEETSNAIISLLENKEKRMSMGADGRKFVEENFGIEKCIDKMVSVYKSAL